MMICCASRMASAVIQHYMSEICESYLSTAASQRSTAARLMSTIVTQGLVLPAHLLPTLICMTTDRGPLLQFASSAMGLIKDLEKRYPGFLHVRITSSLIQIHYFFIRMYSLSLLQLFTDIEIDIHIHIVLTFKCSLIQFIAQSR